MHPSSHCDVPPVHLLLLLLLMLQGLLTVIYMTQAGDCAVRCWGEDLTSEGERGSLPPLLVTRV